MSVKYIKGNIFESTCEAIVNPVNCVGVMGAGLAKQFKERYPDNYIAYRNFCKKNLMKIGTILIVEPELTIFTILNFPTKIHWKDSSKLEYIEKGLFALVNVIEHDKFESVAIPKLGCGLGGLEWEEVKQLFVKYLEELDCNIECYI